MSKGEDTKERILEQTAPLFNKYGYFGASLADVLKVTGLGKGGIYNHFGSKEELAMEAFERSARCVLQRFTDRLEGKTSAVDRLLVYPEIFRGNFADPPVPGGCPILNTAIESDDAHPMLRERAQAAMDRWRMRIRTIVEDGKSSGELKDDLNGDAIATYIIATLEGATMMSRLYGDPIHLERASQMVSEFIRRELPA